MYYVLKQLKEVTGNIFVTVTCVKGFIINFIACLPREYDSCLLIVAMTVMIMMTLAEIGWLAKATFIFYLVRIEAGK